MNKMAKRLGILSLFLLGLIGSSMALYEQCLRFLFLYPLRMLCLFALWWMSSRILVLDVMKKDIGDQWKNAAVGGYALLSLLLFLEAVFMWVPQSHEVGYTLAAQTWHRYCWHPFNELGYRDEAIQAKENKKAVLVVGDSFTAGYGVCSVEDRFSNQLGQQLGDDYHVYNLGRNGSDTRDAFQRLQAYPISADFLILQYYCNDLDGIAAEQGLDFGGFSPYQHLSPALRPFIKASFLLNYLYWQLPQSDMQPYNQFLEEAWANEAIVDTHLQDLQQFADYASEHEIQLVVLLFPFLRDVEGSFYVDRVAQFFQQQQVPSLDVRLLVDDLSVAERIANPKDGHPSVEVHKRVSEQLVEMIEK